MSSFSPCSLVFFKYFNTLRTGVYQKPNQEHSSSLHTLKFYFQNFQHKESYVGYPRSILYVNTQFTSCGKTSCQGAVLF